MDDSLFKFPKCEMCFSVSVYFVKKKRQKKFMKMHNLIDKRKAQLQWKPYVDILSKDRQLGIKQRQTHKK
jgi:hypothetical protein